MNRDTLQMREFIRRLIAWEARENPSSAAKAPGVFRVFEKLRLHLTSLTGGGGFRVLLSRALSLTSAEFGWLRELNVKGDVSVGGLEEQQARLTEGEFLEGSVALLARVLELLVAFIGEDLTLRLLADIWPKVSPGDFHFDNGGKK